MITFTLYNADCKGNKNNTQYNNKVSITSLDDVKNAITYDYTPFNFDKKSRCKEVNKGTDCIVLDIDGTNRVNEYNEKYTVYHDANQLKEVLLSLGLYGIITPSYSYDATKGIFKYRVFLPLGYHISSESEYKELITKIAYNFSMHIHGIEIDSNATDYARFFFTSLTKDGVTFKDKSHLDNSFIVDGLPIVDAIEQFKKPTDNFIQRYDKKRNTGGSRKNKGNKKNRVNTDNTDYIIDANLDNACIAIIQAMGNVNSTYNDIILPLAMLYNSCGINHDAIVDYIANNTGTSKSMYEIDNIFNYIQDTTGVGGLVMMLTNIPTDTTIDPIVVDGVKISAIGYILNYTGVSNNIASELNRLAISTISDTMGYISIKGIKIASSTLNIAIEGEESDIISYLRLYFSKYHAINNLVKRITTIKAVIKPTIQKMELNQDGYIQDMPMHDGAVIQARMGCGKTFNIANNVTRTISENNLHSGNFIIVAPLKKLVERQATDLKNQFVAMGVNISVIPMYSGSGYNKHDGLQADIRVFFSTYDKIDKAIELSGNDVTFLVVDECHNLYTANYRINAIDSVIDAIEKYPTTLLTATCNTMILDSMINKKLTFYKYEKENKQVNHVLLKYDSHNTKKEQLFNCITGLMSAYKHGLIIQNSKLSNAFIGNDFSGNNWDSDMLDFIEANGIGVYNADNQDNKRYKYNVMINGIFSGFVCSTSIHAEGHNFYSGSEKTALVIVNDGSITIEQIAQACGRDRTDNAIVYIISTYELNEALPLRINDACFFSDCDILKERLQYLIEHKSNKNKEYLRQYVKTGCVGFIINGNKELVTDYSDIEIDSYINHHDMYINNLGVAMHVYQDYSRNITGCETNLAMALKDYYVDCIPMGYGLDFIVDAKKIASDIKEYKSNSKELAIQAIDAITMGTIDMDCDIRDFIKENHIKCDIELFIYYVNLLRFIDNPLDRGFYCRLLKEYSMKEIYSLIERMQAVQGLDYSIADHLIDIWNVSYQGNMKDTIYTISKAWNELIQNSRLKATDKMLYITLFDTAKKQDTFIKKLYKDYTVKETKQQGNGANRGKRLHSYSKHYLLNSENKHLLFVLGYLKEFQLNENVQGRLDNKHRITFNFLINDLAIEKIEAI